MISRINASSEVSLFPTGLGNHYVSSSKHLIPPERRSFPYNHATSSSSMCDDPSAPEANTSYNEYQEYFGPDVLVIIGLVLSCVGAVLTLVSFYCEFQHPAIQATMAGIGPSLVGIGMLFCILRIFFCTFCISRTCCECIGDGLRFMVLRCPCFRCLRKQKQIHPLHVKDINTQTLPPPQRKISAVANGHAAIKTPNAFSGKAKDSKHRNNNNNNNNTITSVQTLEMTSLRMDPIHENEERQALTSVITTSGTTSVQISPENSSEVGRREVEEILKDEIDLLDEFKSEKTSPGSLHVDINELVLKNSRRY